MLTHPQARVAPMIGAGGLADPQDAAFRDLVRDTTDSIVAALGALLDDERRARGWTVERAAREAHLSKRALVMHRTTRCNPRLGSLVAQALALDGVLEVRYTVPTGGPARSGR
jgi:lambda repressor-like predicted transcriptional regulator